MNLSEVSQDKQPKKHLMKPLHTESYAMQFSPASFLLAIKS